MFTETIIDNNYYYNLLWVEPIEDDLLFGGMAIDKISTNRDLLIIRTDTAFNIKWDTIFGSEDTDLMESLFVSNNDKFYVNSIQHTDTNGIFCIYKFNNTGLITASISKVYNVQSIAKKAST